MVRLKAKTSIAVGKLRAIWYDKAGQLVQIYNGSAFPITQRLLLTCSHNIYHQELKRFASKIVFILETAQNGIQKSAVFSSDNVQYYKSEALQADRKIDPCKQQLALVVLSKPLKTKSFPKIGRIKRDELGKQMMVIGYPNKTPKNSTNFNIKNNILKRTESPGRLSPPNQTQNYIIYYTMKTFARMSGGPILMWKGHGSFKIVGIHTHAGNTQDHNKGLHFNDETLLKIQKWVGELQEQFHLQKSQIFDQEMDVTQQLQENHHIYRQRQFERGTGMYQPIGDCDQQQYDSIMNQAEEVEQSEGYEQFENRSQIDNVDDQEDYLDEQFENRSQIGNFYELFQEDLDQLLRKGQPIQ